MSVTVNIETLLLLLVLCSAQSVSQSVFTISQLRRRPLLGGVNACLAKCLNTVLNVKALLCAFNQKALVGAFSVI